MFKKYFLRVAALLMIIIPEVGIAQPPVEADAPSLLSAFVAYTDLRMSAVQRSLEILAATNEAKSAQWEKMEPLLSGYQRSEGGGLIVWFVRPDGTYFTVDKGLMNVKLSDRSYFPKLMSGQKIMGDLIVSKSTGQRSAVIAIPMKEGGKVIGAIGASLFLDKLAEEVGSALPLQADAAFFALAPNGQTALHKKTDRHFLDPRELGSETLKKATNEMLSNPAGETSYEFDNVTKRAIYRTSPLTQWKFVITFSDTRQK